jgi:hypothetical protein
MNRAAHHETFVERAKVRRSSDSEFGVVIGLVLLAVGLWPLWHGGGARMPAIGVAAVLLALAWLWPAGLRPANRLWTAFGLLLGKITAPLVTGALFYLVFTPAAFLMRLAGRDALRLRSGSSSGSYWTNRAGPSSGAGSMTNQF